MAFDLIVGVGGKTGGAHEVVACIDYHELPALLCLVKRIDSFFLQRISNLFEDQVFSPEEVEQALSHLLPLLVEPGGAGEQALLHKLIAALAYAKHKRLSLIGMAD
ncbi:hypothetical protein [Chitinimonas sp.]|uniref:hypothetical protein n=1 Tax=Chitinimonas sp. TaxID=1934313 RepID=UPI0035B1FD33